MAKRTPWFPLHVKPARAGVYEVASSMLSDIGLDFDLYALWDGRSWGPFCPSVSRAILPPPEPNFFTHQGKSWRGLASKPK